MRRVDAVLEQARNLGIDALAVLPGANLRYLTGLEYHHGERLALAIFPARGEAAFVLPAMEARRIEQKSSLAFRLYPWSDAQPAETALERAINDLGLERKTFAVEFLTMRIFELRMLETAAMPSELIDATPLLAQQRAVKDVEEVQLMRRAAEMIDLSLQRLLPRIQLGMSERQVAALWNSEILAAGADGPSFDCIIASGPNSAFPHHTTSDRKLEVGDFVILDGGARYQGYCSDITRTVSMGAPRPELKLIYETVLRANLAAQKAAGLGGASGASVDAAARRLITEAGYGEQFMHRTGHGLGIDVHEQPYITGDNPIPLRQGNTFTIEPGIYVSGLGGVRIEDDLVLAAEGPVCLTQSPRDLIVL